MVNYEEFTAKFWIAVNKGEKKVLKALCIDPGQTNLAVCIIDREYGTAWSTKIELPDGLLTTASKVRYNEMIVEHYVRTFHPDVIFKEGVAFGKEFGVSDAGKTQYAIERVAMDHMIPCYTITNPSMRSFMGCKAKGESKSEVRMLVLDKFGKKFPTEDETDAYAIGETGFAILEGSYEVNKAKDKRKR